MNTHEFRLIVTLGETRLVEEMIPQLEANNFVIRNKAPYENHIIEIDSVNDLLEMMDILGCDIVLLPKGDWHKDLPTIEIYNDYRE